MTAELLDLWEREAQKIVGDHREEHPHATRTGTMARRVLRLIVAVRRGKRALVKYDQPWNGSRWIAAQARVDIEALLTEAERSDASRD